MGEITKLLLDKWSENVNLDIKKQMEDYSVEVDKILEMHQHLLFLILKKNEITTSCSNTKSKSKHT